MEIVMNEIKKLIVEEGFEEFKWITNIDGRERELHKELNGKIFRFDDPPIIDERTGRIIMMGALDNLVKGAAGQAVQNMNLIFGLPETEGLMMVPMFP